MRHFVLVTSCFLSLSFVSSSFAATPDFAGINDIPTRQAAFFDFIQDLAQQADQEILEDRGRVKQLQIQWQAEAQLEQADQDWLAQLSQTYLLNDFDIQQQASWDELLNRVDIVPASLILAQAANESAWGTSRFAQEGSNYFGQWCFEPGCGIVPLGRPEGSTYEVQAFDLPLDSVNGYLHNLNTSSNYADLREFRYRQHAAGEALTGNELAAGLTHYSELGDEYVDMIQALIRIHDLEQYNAQDQSVY